MTAGPIIITDSKTRPTKAEREAEVRGSYWLPTQRRWIESKARKKIMEKTRRYGGSWAEAYSVSKKTGRTGNTYDAWISSRDLLAARLFINDVKTHVRALATAASEVEENPVLLSDLTGKDAFQAFQINLFGHSITSLSSNADALAGKQGYFTKDEAALDAHLRQWYSIVQPAMMRGGTLSMISTHRGRTNFFNQLIEEIKHKGNPKKFELYSIPITKAVEEGLWIKIRDALPDDDERKEWTEDEFLQSLRDECPDDEAWKQEYNCQPSDEADALLSWEDIIGCTVNDIDQAVLNALPKTTKRVVGMDVARRRHLSVIWVAAQVNGVLLPERVITLEKKKFSEQEAVLYPILDDPATTACRIDATGLGMQLAERAETRHPSKVQGIMLTAPRKLELATAGQRRFQDRTVRVPDDRVVHYDLFSVKKEISSSENILLRSEAGETDGHADRFWALMMAIEAAENHKEMGLFGRLKSLMEGDQTRRAARRSRSAE